MRIGPMRHRVEIQVRQDLRDGFGQPKPVWATIATVWGEFQPLSGRETIQARIAQSEISAQWVIRYRSDVTPRHRLLFGERVFDINAAIDEDGKRQLLKLLCTEKV